MCLLGSIDSRICHMGWTFFEMPTTPVPTSKCLSVEFEGPIFDLLWDGSDDQWFESSLKSRLFQLQHEQAGATIATGSWDLTGAVFPRNGYGTLVGEKQWIGRGK